VIHVSHSIDIRRSPEDVFAYVTDPANLHTWQDAEAVEQLTSGPVRTGTRFREVHKALGRRRTEITEVVLFDHGRRFAIRVVDGPPVDGRWDFEAIDGGTRVTMTPQVRMPAPIAPFAALATVLVFSRFHRRLKRALETGAAQSSFS
jgi:hypothetical protein